MKSINRRPGLTTALVIASVAIVFAMSSGVTAQPPSTPSTPGSSDLGAAPKEVFKDPQGMVTQVVPKDPVPAPAGTPSDAGAQAQAQADTVKQVFEAAPVGNLVVDQVFPVGEGSTVRMRQEIDSIPVFGASVAQSLAADGSLISVTGALTQKSQGTFPEGAATPPAEVSKTAVQAIADQTQQPIDRYAVTEVKANWYDPKLAAVEDAASVAVPAFKVAVKDPGEKGGHPGEWVVFVDAGNTGKVLDSWGETKQLNRVVCDAARTVVDLDSQQDPTECGTSNGFPATRAEGQAPASIADVDNIYDYFGATEKFYQGYTPLKNLTDLIGADTGDGNGKALRGTVRICSPDQCPYANAFWNNDHMAYGEGVTTDDITGHELTHGVTQHVNGLVYRNDSGAINESMSDVFGQFVFITNAGPYYNAGTRWQLGNGSVLGVIRDMKDPKSHKQPDSYQGQYWYTAANPNDPRQQSALVHTNSGVGNKAAQLITDGGSLNGQNVGGIGLEKAAQLYWTTQTLLTGNATYRTLGTALATACKTNVQNKVAGTTADDCAQVVNATKAVKMPSLDRTT
ncbi:M4 family metallopeptidase [Nocardia sp. NPDC020380]|uniref:M4 family metallopeptidase n=1 Tax=Nocardia sp. NPDC020380 TaxID=3364309 RepID=UPI0037ABE5D5